MGSVRLPEFLSNLSLMPCPGHSRQLISRFFKENSQSYKSMTGAAAGLNAVVLTYPLDLVRARLTFRVDPKVTVGGVVENAAASVQHQTRPTVFGTLASVAKNEGGLAGLYRGLTPAVVFVIPYSAANFYTFEMVKFTFITRFSKWCTEEMNGEHVLNIPSKFLAGGLAGWSDHQSCQCSIFKISRDDALRCLWSNPCFSDRCLSPKNAAKLHG